MKVCPICQSRYTDDTLQFCLQDGANLINEASENSMPTVAFTDEETVVKAKQVENPAFDMQNSRQSQSWQPDGAANSQPAVRKSNTALIVITTILATIVIFGAAGFGAWLYFANKTEVAQNTNVKNSFPKNSVKNSNENSAVFPPSNADETANAQPTATKTPAPREFDPEVVKDEVSDTVDSWASLTESRNISAYMNYYADTVDYYSKKGVSAGAVRADKQRAFSAYNTIEMNVSNMRVTPDASGETATAVFDKEWYFENSEKSSEGKVQSELRLRKIGGAWKITSERDLKVYYVK